MKGLEEPEMDPKSRDLLVQQASQCLSKLVQIASRTKRNFILDQVLFRNSSEHIGNPLSLWITVQTVCSHLGLRPVSFELYLQSLWLQDPLKLEPALP